MLTGSEWSPPVTMSPNSQLIDFHRLDSNDGTAELCASRGEAEVRTSRKDYCQSTGVVEDRQAVESYELTGKTLVEGCNLKVRIDLRMSLYRTSKVKQKPIGVAQEEAHDKRILALDTQHYKSGLRNSVFGYTRSIASNKIAFGVTSQALNRFFYRHDKRSLVTF
nr:hypothetical protein CFP56_79373 [Quercus suber]